MKTNIGDINNRYSQEKESGRQERFFNTAMNAVTVLIVAFGIGLIISFITIPR